MQAFYKKEEKNKKENKFIFLTSSFYIHLF